ncbi:MAG: hypothetical protein HW419_4731 [Deltaproteobacteria bacterium]|nr:hypothetical protein [Deltaproteobacteria bacterium]
MPSRHHWRTELSAIDRICTTNEPWPEAMERRFKLDPHKRTALSYRNLD